ncbi:MAG: peptidylprolyl isomerase [Treponema sp.]|jgi:FKBP-type peptidyl-prolyl cis-trans isomerase SlyD|nr:peptidylprolyl isomerase [Treponema sp.]
MVKTVMNIARNTIVSFDYTLTNDSSQVLDSSFGAEPLAYLHGHGNIIPGLEQTLEGKNQGDSFRIKVAAADAYGLRDDNLIFSIPRNRFGDEAVEEGMEFQAQTPDGGYRIVRIAAIAGDKVTIDGNHPLAGMDLTFDVTVRDIREASEEEIAHGHPNNAHHHHGEEGCDGCGNCGTQGCCGH